MQVQPRLLDHPFYVAWMKGEVSQKTLAAYHRSYAEFIQRIPSYWQTVVKAFQPHLTHTSSVVQEELHHIDLWEKWGKRFTPPDDFPRMQSVLDLLDGMTPSQLLGAIHAFEVQQPEVARTKKEGLLRHYGFRHEELRYFDEHENEECHLAYGRWLAGCFANPAEFNAFRSCRLSNLKKVNPSGIRNNRAFLH